MNGLKLHSDAGAGSWWNGKKDALSAKLAGWSRLLDIGYCRLAAEQRSGNQCGLGD
jgi:hypothetical protein